MSNESFNRLIIGVIIGAPILTIVSAIWPAEPITILLTCVVLGFAIFLSLPFVRSLRCLFAAVTSLSILLSVATTDWPQRTAFALSRAAFDRLSEQVLAGTPPPTPGRFGLFYIEQAEINRRGIVCLWTNMDPAGRTGFVRCSNQDLPFNLWSKLNLDETWHFIHED